MSGTTYKQGDVVLVSFPFTDLSGVKKRPALVLSSVSLGDDIIVCPITSVPQEQHAVPLVSLAQGVLPLRSYVKPAKITTLDKSLIFKRTGQVYPETLVSVQEMLRSVLA